jgi:hypothetical protein
MNAEVKVHELLLKHGYKLERSRKHQVWRNAQLNCQIVFPSTPSDRRSWDNALPALKRQIAGQPTRGQQVRFALTPEMDAAFNKTLDKTEKIRGGSIQRPAKTKGTGYKYEDQESVPLTPEQEAEAQALKARIAQSNLLKWERKQSQKALKEAARLVKETAKQQKTEVVDNAMKYCSELLDNEATFWLEKEMVILNFDWSAEQDGSLDVDSIMKAAREDLSLYLDNESWENLDQLDEIVNLWKTFCANTPIQSLVNEAQQLLEEPIRQALYKSLVQEDGLSKVSPPAVRERLWSKVDDIDNKIDDCVEREDTVEDKDLYETIWKRHKKLIMCHYLLASFIDDFDPLGERETENEEEEEEGTLTAEQQGGPE